MIDRFSIPKPYAFGVLAIVGIVYAIWLMSPPNIPVGRATVRVISNLRALDGAKQRWAQERGQAGAVVVGEQDIAPYLAHDRIRPVGGERYVLKPLGQAPEVELNRDMLGCVKGTRLGLSDEGDLVRLPNEPLQPTTR